MLRSLVDLTDTFRGYYRKFRPESINRPDFFDGLVEAIS